MPKNEKLISLPPFTLRRKRSSIKDLLESSEIGDRLAALVNNEFLSDVTFLVGDQKIKIYAHKTLLALSSPVFYRMLYGDLKMDTSQPIEIPDLTQVGFINMIRYIYGDGENEETSVFKDDLIEFSETYKAADKYLVYGMVDRLVRNASSKLRLDTCMIIYDQFKKLNIEPKFLTKIKNMISINSKAAFESRSFVQIDQNTLIDILNFKRLNINEPDILNACVNWVNYKCIDGTFQNRQDLFKPIKNFIRFSDLNFEKLKNCINLDYLLTYAEIGNIFIHLMDRSKPLLIVCQTKREPFEIFDIYSTKNILWGYTTYDSMEMNGTLTVNRNVFLFSIHTYFKTEVTNLDFKLLHPEFKGSKELAIPFEKKIYDSDEPKWSFIFREIVELEANKSYKFSFKFNFPFRSNHYRLHASKDLNLKLLKNDIPFEFKLTFENFKCHGIHSIQFSVPS